MSPRKRTAQEIVDLELIEHFDAKSDDEFNLREVYSGQVHYTEDQAFILCAVKTLHVGPRVKEAYWRYRGQSGHHTALNALEAIALYIEKQESDTIWDLDMDKFCHWGYVCKLAKTEEMQARVRRYLPH